MSPTKLKIVTLGLGLSLLLAGCAPASSDRSSGRSSGRSIELSAGSVLAVDFHPERNAQDPVRADIGRQFIVEHFEAAANGLMLQAIAQHRPAGFVFWNSNKTDGSGLREVIRAYAAKAAASGDHKGLLFSTDYEGGGLAYTINSNPLVGIQRFRQGMTGLVHPSWLERSMPQFGTELCKLHGEIMTAELTSVGINYPLTMVSDLSNELFAMRSVSKDPAKVSACLQASMDAFFDNGHIVFVTKHFPGLGQTKGDTHNGTVVSRLRSMEDEQQHLKPFIDLINNSKAKGQPDLLSILASHAEVPLFDTEHLTTESSKILKGVMRGQLGFGGLIVSDAMWMGEYEPLTLTQMLPVYLNSFVSGMDLLMIKGGHFAGAVDFFRHVYDNEVSADLKADCEKRSGQPWDELRQRFIVRIKDSSQRLDQVVAKLGDPRDQMPQNNVSPRTQTTLLRNRYDQILLAIDPRWRSVLPALRAKEESVRLTQTLASAK
jgi:beta-glucosidase-like glycosyl hydrolase